MITFDEREVDRRCRSDALAARLMPVFRLLPFSDFVGFLRRYVSNLDGIPDEQRVEFLPRLSTKEKLARLACVLPEARMSISTEPHFEEPWISGVVAPARRGVGSPPSNRRTKALEQRTFREEVRIDRKPRDFLRACRGPRLGVGGSTWCSSGENSVLT
jgi:hypothetical protein